MCTPIATDPQSALAVLASQKPAGPAAHPAPPPPKPASGPLHSAAAHRGRKLDLAI